MFLCVYTHHASTAICSQMAALRTRTWRGYVNLLRRTTSKSLRFAAVCLSCVSHSTPKCKQRCHTGSRCALRCMLCTAVMLSECKTFLKRFWSSSCLLLILPPAGAVRAVLWDGLHVPALQDLRRERQRREDWALQAPDVHILSDSLAGEDASALVGFYYTGLRQQCILTAREEIPRQTLFSNKVPPFGCRENGDKFSIILSGFKASEEKF